MSFAPALAGFIRAVIGPLDYYACYPAKVVAQNSDGTLELVPDNPRIAPHSAVPIRGLPGVAVKVAPGARALLEFANGSPKAPIATLFEAHSLLEVVVTADVKVSISAPLVVLAGTSGSVANGEALNSAISALGNAIGTAVGTVPGGAAAGGTITTAVEVFSTSAANALSASVRVA